jgi:hypothetical protein
VCAASLSQPISLDFFDRCGGEQCPAVSAGRRERVTPPLGTGVVSLAHRMHGTGSRTIFCSAFSRLRFVSSRRATGRPKRIPCRCRCMRCRERDQQFSSACPYGARHLCQLYLFRQATYYYSIVLLFGAATPYASCPVCSDLCLHAHSCFTTRLRRPFFFRNTVKT